MHVQLKLTLDCHPDAAWDAIRSPTVFREAALPLLQFRSLEPNGFPGRWEEGQHPVRLSLLGAVPLGSQSIGVELSTPEPGVRMLRDRGTGLTGINRVFTEWDHRMAVSAHPDGRGTTLYRDRLHFSAGALTPAIWPSLWALWQFRGARLAALASRWPEPGSR